MIHTRCVHSTIKNVKPINNGTSSTKQSFFRRYRRLPRWREASYIPKTHRTHCYLALSARCM